MTPRQQSALEFIRAYVIEHGIAPTYGEIARAVGLHSKSNAHFVVDALIAGGLLVRTPYRVRGLIVADVCPHCKRPFQHKVAA